MNFLFKRDQWLRINDDIKICYNPTPANLLLYKQAFFQNVIGMKREYIIFEEISFFKKIITNNDKIKTLIVLPNRGYCISFEQDLRKSGFYEHFDFTLKHKTQITLQNKKNNPIEDEVYDLIFIKEDVTIEWLMKKKISLNGTFYIFLHNNFLTLKSYQYLLNNFKSNKITSS